MVIINYHKLSKWAHYLDTHIRSIIFDEIQELRTGKQSLKGAAAYRLAQVAAFRVGLSATPSFNFGGEMYNIVEAIKPNMLGTREEFSREWLDWRGKGLKDPKAFGHYLRDQGLMLRRTREDVGRELKPLTKVPNWIDFDFDALDGIASSADELALAIAKNVDVAQTDKFAMENEFKQVLRQMTGIGKAPYIAEFVRLLLETGETVVLYAWHREVYNILMDRLSEFRPAMYTGSESPAKKRKEFDRFVSKDTPLLIISLRSGAGLDGLQHHCRTVVIGELDWSPAVHEQCIGRVHRDGQLDEVTAYFLLAKGGSDPFIANLLGLKREQIEGVKNPDGTIAPKYDLDGTNLKKLAMAYIKQRRTGSIKIMKKKHLEPISLTSKRRFKQKLGSVAIKKLQHEIIQFSKRRTLLDEDAVRDLGDRLDVRIPKEVLRRLAKKTYQAVWDAACRCKIEGRKELQPSDL